MTADSRAFLDRVRATIADHQMLAPGDRVLVGVSGGPDSMVLLHALHALDYDVIVAHLDHGTRDGVSAEDAEFVRAQSEILNCRFTSERVNVANLAQTKNESFETAARHARYKFFSRVASDNRCVAVATGHHADDQAETVLLRLLRGTSPQGIAGIPPVRPLDSVRVIRPLITSTRAEISAYVSENNVAFREDTTNTDTSIPRNRIRHDLLPMLKRDFNPRVTDALVRLADMARDDERIVETETKQFAECCLASQSINRQAFAAGLVALQRRLVVVFAHDLGVSIPFERVEAAREFVLHGTTGARLELGDGVTIVNTKGTTSRYQAPSAPEAPVAIQVPGYGDALGKRFDIRLNHTAPAEPLRDYCTPQRQVFDADTIGTSMIVRSRKPGDRFTPLGMSGERKLQDYFVDVGVPQDQRDRVPIVEAGGRIAWIVGGAVDTHFAVHDTTREFIEMEVTDATE